MTAPGLDRLSRLNREKRLEPLDLQEAHCSPLLVNCNPIQDSRERAVSVVKPDQRWEFPGSRLGKVLMQTTFKRGPSPAANGGRNDAPSRGFHLLARMTPL